MKLDSFAIEFDSGGQYMAGQPVSGCLVFDATESIQLERIGMKLLGRITCSWVNTTSDIYYESKKEIIHQNLDLSPYLSQVSDGHLLPRGKHRISFVFQLPEALPSSVYHEAFGWVSYSCAALVQIAKASCIPIFASANREVLLEKTFKVRANLALTSCPKYLEPSDAVDSKSMVSCCRRRGFIAASLSVEKTGFLIGETLQAKIKLENGTNKKISQNTTVVLCQRIDFKAKNIYRHDVELFDNKNVITRIAEAAGLVQAEPRVEPTPFCFDLPIPAGLAPSTVSDDLICISYFLKMEMKQFDLHLSVIIATKHN